MGAGRQVARVALFVTAALALCLAAQVAAVSGLQHRASQQGAFDRLRQELADGTAPLGAADRSNRALPGGTPVALIEIPSIHVHEVVGEGTSPGALMTGPGHRRSSPFPGQDGTSVILGRFASYGGPFKRLHRLRTGATIRVTTGQGVSSFRVTGRRRPGDPSPPPLGSGHGRLLLVTASGAPFVPSGVVRVDADLVTPALPRQRAPVPAGQVPASEEIMGTDRGALAPLVLWIEALTAVAVGIVVSWNRWGHHQTWIVFVPLTAVVGLLAAEQFTKLVPNLL